MERLHIIPQFKAWGALCRSNLRVYLKREQEKEARRNSEIESWILHSFYFINKESKACKNWLTARPRLKTETQGLRAQIYTDSHLEWQQPPDPCGSVPEACHSQSQSSTLTWVGKRSTESIEWGTVPRCHFFLFTFLWV